MTATIETTERTVRERYMHADPGSLTEGELIQEYLPLVKTVVGRVALTLPTHVSVDDLHSAGMIGLLQALRNFDYTKGASFETYARIRIRGAVMDELRRMDWVSRSAREKSRKVAAVMQQLEQAKGGVPTEEEIAEGLSIPLEEYRDLLEEIKPATFVSLDVAIMPDDEDSMAASETLADPGQETPLAAAARRDLVELITARMQQLPEMQRKVLALYYFEDLRLREIAEAFGVTESRICQIHAQAILAIKSFLAEQEQDLRGQRKGVAA
jgi:RNA polymerase sigma factor for flagellar operon FliA